MPLGYSFFASGKERQHQAEQAQKRAEDAPINESRPILGPLHLIFFLPFKLSDDDAPMAERLKAARSRNRVLRYVGALDAATGKA